MRQVVCSSACRVSDWLTTVPRTRSHGDGPRSVALAPRHVAPRSDGRPTLSLAVQFVGGVSIPVSKRVSVSAALEVPWTYYRHQMLGLTALTGVSFRF